MSERYYSEPLARRGNKQKHYFYQGEKPFLFTRLQWIAWVDSTGECYYYNFAEISQQTSPKLRDHYGQEGRNASCRRAGKHFVFSFASTRQRSQHVVLSLIFWRVSNTQSIKGLKMPWRELLQLNMSNGGYKMQSHKLFVAYVAKDANTLLVNIL
jgi:hypothetical protein